MCSGMAGGSSSTEWRESTECFEQYELWVCFPGWHLVPQRTAANKLLWAEAIH